MFYQHEKDPQEVSTKARAYNQSAREAKAEKLLASLGYTMGLPSQKNEGRGGERNLTSTVSPTAFILH